MDHKILLLNRLLDKYEKSKAYLDPGVKRRIMLTLGSVDYPEYDIENSLKREIINAAVLELSEKGLLQYEWLKHERGNIIAKAWLQLDRAGVAYRECGRVPKSAKASAVLQLVQNSRQKVISPWIIHFLEDTLTRIEKKKSPLPHLPEDPQQAQEILQALEDVEQIGKDPANVECLERVFSLKCYGDSKYFERHVKRKIIAIIKKYLLIEGNSVHDYEEIGDEEVLRQVGIVKAPELMEFSGGMIGKITGRQVDFSVFAQGIAVNSYTVANLKIIDFAPEVRRVLLIENKANYMDYVFHKAQDNEFVVYHGGFYSPAKGRFFQKIYQVGHRKGLEFFHWGDIDLGGFQIFHRLRTKIISELQPYLMDTKALLSKEKYWTPMDKNYKIKVEELRKSEEFALFHNVIDIMLEHNCKLEQEAFLI